MSRLLFDAFEGVSGVAFGPPNPYARMMFSLLPPGKAWRPERDSLLYKLLAACADELGRIDTRVTDLLNEADPSTCNELLPEYERELGIVVVPPPTVSAGFDGGAFDSGAFDSGSATIETTAERRAAVVARRVARQRYRPVDFQTALAPLLGQVAANVVVIETSHASALAMGDVREIYRFFIYRNPALTGTYYVTSAQALVDAIKPSHTVGHVIESIAFIAGDPRSICGRDLLGL